ncbi:methyltransferase [Verrucomicrobiota bacterium]
MEILNLISAGIRRGVTKTVKNWLCARWQKHPAPVYDAGASSNNSNQSKRALLSYITDPFRLSPDDPINVQFSNTGIARSIVNVLNELGYSVDVIQYTDTKFVPRKGYDLFIGNGGYNFEGIARNLSVDTIKIYFSTGIYWKDFNRKEAERFRQLEERRGVRLPHDRWINHSEEHANRSADAIICLGNKHARESYSQFPSVLNLNNAAYPDDHYDQIKKNFSAARSNFLFFSGSGNIHKGLDILLEAFVQMDTHLYICQGMSPGFYKLYRRELNDYPNIHLVGLVPARSSQFYELADKCAFVIQPFCAEGQPGSAVECMHQGLIPVVSQETNIDTNDYGITLNTCSIEGIVEAVKDLSQRPPEWCEEMAQRTRKAAIAKFSADVFSLNMKNAIRHVIDRKTDKRETRMESFFVDEHLNISVGNDATTNLASRNDKRFLQERQGITQVDMGRWKEAQRYEQRTWMEAGCKAREDRNSEHEKHFDNYKTIQGMYFDKAIEIGCGPFTNMARILKHIKCGEVTLLDPLINSYLSHQHCAYKHKRLGGWFGRKVHAIAKPIENFTSDKRFDLVVMINVLEHCFLAPKVFEHIISLTAPGGILIFHDKLIKNEAINVLTGKIYDAGHPLRVAEDVILEFLSKNYNELFRKHVIIPTDVYMFNSIYFIGQKNVK